MTKKTVHVRKTHAKRSDEKPVAKRNQRAARRAKIRREPPLDKTPVTLPKHEFERLDRLLAYAQDTAILAAPRIPPLRGLSGAAAAVDTHDTLRLARELIATAMEGGGAS